MALAVVPGVLRDQLVSAAQPVAIAQLLQGRHDPIVYFIGHGERIKIGFTTNLKGRVNALALRPDSILLALDGGPDLERALHDRFAGDRIDDTEWFEPGPEITRYLEDRKREVPRQAGRSAADIRRRVVTHKEPTEAEQVALLADLADVIGSAQRIRTREALQLLSERSPDTYRAWTFQDLTRVLRAAGAPPYPYQGRVSIARHAVLAALDAIRTQ